MRVRSLDLIRYGHFTDATVEFPLREPDLHIIFGPNEAGKSTILSAFEDLLFGIPKKASLNFLHKNADLRLGAVLEANGRQLAVRRRWGYRHTLLDSNEETLSMGEQALSPFLEHADRSFFERMFSLDHKRLRKGGQEILDAQDEVGQMLFSAGAGISDLRGRMLTLEQEADELWAPRRSEKRRYYPADDRRKKAEARRRDLTISAERYQRLERQFLACQEDFDRIDQEIRTKDSERRKLSRIRRVIPDIRRLDELDQGIETLGKPASLPEDARAILDRAVSEVRKAEENLKTRRSDLEDLLKERDALPWNEALLLREDDIIHLNEQRIQVRAGKSDLPKRMVELAQGESELRRLAAELGWESQDTEPLFRPIPSRARVTRVRELLASRGERRSKVEAAQAACAEAESRYADADGELREVGAALDVSRLSAQIAAMTSESGEIASRIRAAEGEVEDSDATVPGLVAALRPAVASAKTAAAMPTPATELVQKHRDARRDLDQRLKACRERVRAHEQELERAKKSHDQIVREERPISAEKLDELRARRDAGWALIRHRYIDDRPVAASELEAFSADHVDLATAFEAAVREADQAADRRVDKAESAANLTAAARRIASRVDELEILRKELDGLLQESRKLDLAWEQLWSDSSLRPLDPDTMLVWLANRAALQDSIDRRDRAQRQAAALRRQEMEAIGRLAGELRLLGEDVSPLMNEPIRVVLEAALGVQRHHQKAADAKSRITAELRRLRVELERKRQALDTARAEESQWKDQWNAGLADLGISVDTSPDVARAHADTLDHMRELANRIQSLRSERIEKIERSITDFQSSVEEFQRECGVGSATLADPDAFVVELARLLEQSKRNREIQRNKDATIESTRTKIRDLEGLRSEAQRAIRSLHDAAGTEDVTSLQQAIDNAERFRELSEERAQVLRSLREQGDGLSVTDLQKECGEVDLDQAAVGESALEEELQLLHTRRMEAHQARRLAKEAYDAVGGGDAAARANAARESALAEIEAVAQQYVRIKTAALILRWGIDRYRQERHAPLLRRAGTLFSELTGRSFSGLQLDFDSQDRGRLVGHRSNGPRVDVLGMSDGTADQLYLAIRVAAIEDYLQKASSLPFLADDLFINFDDRRAAAGFRVLEQFARRCQVIFFTHHEHLLEIARTALSQPPSVHALTDRTYLR